MVDLYELYDVTARAMKEVDPDIRVGPSFGVSTTQMYMDILSVYNETSMFFAILNY